MHKSLFAAALLLAGCAKPVLETGLQIDERAQHFIYEFERSALLNGKRIQISQLTVVFTELESYTLGRCTLPLNGATPLIRINATSWEQLGYYGRRQLMFHELGHCVLGLDHVAAPGSIMYLYHLGPALYNSQTYTKLETELFSQTTKYNTQRR